MRSSVLMILCVTVISAHSEILEPLFAGYGTSGLRRTTAQESDSRCTTPDSLCVKIFECDKVYQRFLQGQSLRSARCGWEKEAPKVCCAIPDVQRRKRNAPAPTCGIPIIKRPRKQNLRRKRVTGGSKKAHLGSWPWMAALFVSRNASQPADFSCGATLISSEWILTAAHCVFDSSNASKKWAYVRLGVVNIDGEGSDGATPVDVNVTEIKKHPQFSTVSLNANIALLRLSKPVNFTEYIRPICVRGGEKYSNESFYGAMRPIMIGWGSTGMGEIESSDLLEIDVDVVKSAECSKKYAKEIGMRELKFDQVICANTNDGNDACQGDSGGPLMFHDNDSWWIGGISSHGVGCGLPEYPGVYTKVAPYVDWIETSTGLKF